MFVANGDRGIVATPLTAPGVILFWESCNYKEGVPQLVEHVKFVYIERESDPSYPKQLCLPRDSCTKFIWDSDMDR